MHHKFAQLLFIFLALGAQSMQTARKASRRVPGLLVNYLRYQGEGKRDDILDGYPNVLATYAIPSTIIPLRLRTQMKGKTHTAGQGGDGHARVDGWMGG